MYKYYYTLLMFFCSNIISLAQTNGCQNIIEIASENWVCAEAFENGYRVLSIAENGQYLEHIIDFEGNLKYSQTIGPIPEVFQFKNGAILTKSINNVVVDSIYFSSLSNISTGVVAKTNTGWVLVYIEDSSQANTIKLIRFNENTQTTSEVNGLLFDNENQLLASIYVLPNNGILLAIEENPRSPSTVTTFVKIDENNHLVSNFKANVNGGSARISSSPCNVNELIILSYNEFIDLGGGSNTFTYNGIYNILNTTLMPKRLITDRSRFESSNRFGTVASDTRIVQSYQSNGDYFKFSNESSFFYDLFSTPPGETTYGLEKFLEKYDKADNLLWKKDFLKIERAPEPVTDTVLNGEPEFFFDLPNNEFIAFGPTNGENKLWIFKSNCEQEPPNPDDTYSCGTINLLVDGTRLTIKGKTGVDYQRMEIINITDGKYETRVLCNRNCGLSQTVDLAVGKYLIKVFNEDWTVACNLDYNTPIIIDNSDTGGNNTGGKTNCDNFIFTGENSQIRIEGLTATYNKVEIIGSNTNWQVITICDGNCAETQVIPNLMAGEYAIKVNLLGEDGSYCYREEKVSVSEGGGHSGGSVNCDNLSFTVINGQIRIDELTATYDKVEIIGQNTNWEVLSICDGDCSDTQNISGLANGEYTVKVNQGGNDGTYCYREEKIVVENSSSNRNNELDLRKELNLYPNPARNSINLRFHRLVEKEGTVNIYTIFGHLIQSFPKVQLTNNPVAIDLNGYENGMYLLSVKVDNLPVMTKRFVVEHLR